jgi:hypothetical protein
MTTAISSAAVAATYISPTPETAAAPSAELAKAPVTSALPALDVPPLADSTIAALVVEQEAATKPAANLQGQDLRSIDLNTLD